MGIKAKTIIKNLIDYAFYLLICGVIAAMAELASPWAQAYLSELFGRDISWSPWTLTILAVAVAWLGATMNTKRWNDIVESRIKDRSVWSKDNRFSKRETVIRRSLQITKQVSDLVLWGATAVVFVQLYTGSLEILRLPFATWLAILFGMVLYIAWPKLDRREKTPLILKGSYRAMRLWMVISLYYASFMIGAMVTGATLDHEPPRTYAKYIEHVIAGLYRSVVYESDPNECISMVENHTYVMVSATTAGTPIFDSDWNQVGLIKPAELFTFDHAVYLSDYEVLYMKLTMQDGTSGWVQSKDTWCRPMEWLREDH